MLSFVLFFFFFLSDDVFFFFFFFQAEDGIRDFHVTGVQTCALPILDALRKPSGHCRGRRISFRPRPRSLFRLPARRLAPPSLPCGRRPGGTRGGRRPDTLRGRSLPSVLRQPARRLRRALS